MKYSSAVLLFNLCTTLYAQGYETPLGSVHDSSMTCESGETPRVTCDGASIDESSCFCKCTNGVNLERTFAQIVQGNGAASKDQTGTDGRACTAHGEDLTHQLNACTLRESDLSHQVETCAAREKHSTDQLDACTARSNELVNNLGSCSAREKNSLTQLEACTVSGKSLNDQLEAAKKQATLDASIASQFKAQIAKLEARMPQYTYKGCYVDAANARILSGTSTSDPGMTAAQCSTFCKAYRYFGTEYGNQCFCGNELSAVQVAVAGCDWPCKGSILENCGGNARITVYENLKV